FGVILGTGVGGGIVVEGKVIVGAQAIAGEWGHNQLPRPGIDEFPGPTCYCGRNGCIETFLSGPAMARDHAVACGQSCTAEEIGELARQGDEIAVATLDRYVDRLGRALASVVNLLDPDIIVLGGGMSNLPDQAERTVLATEPHVFTDRPRVTIVTNVHGDSSGVRGAAWLWNTNQKQACSSAAQE
ncbi:MAG: ROK family protein, partial [Gammaproteobacteria bacterium]